MTCTTPRVYYTVRGETLQRRTRLRGRGGRAGAGQGHAAHAGSGRGTGVRFTPTLAFVLDKVPDTAHHMEELLARARAADEDLARVRQGAKHAGDADPYRVGAGAGGGPAGSWTTS